MGPERRELTTQGREWIKQKTGLERSHVYYLRHEGDRRVVVDVSTGRGRPIRLNMTRHYLSDLGGR